MTMTVLEIIGLVAIAVGCFFYFVGVFGLIRMPDVYLRIQGAGKTSTLGIAGLSLGAAILSPESILQVIALGLFMVMSGPVIAHAIAASAFRSGVKMANPLRNDLDGITPEDLEEPD
jgi:multicomponent Na+:H+ antiporter subunit G